jgi:hypothetical protein
VGKARSSCSRRRRAPERWGSRCRMEVGIVGGAREGHHGDWRGGFVGLICGRGGELREFGLASPACGGCEPVSSD